MGILGEERIPYKLIEVLNNKLSKDKSFKKHFKWIFIGNVTEKMKQLINKETLSENIEYVPYLPHYEAISKASAADILLLLLYPYKTHYGHIPGKTFEYMALKKPILSLGASGGEVSNLLKQIQDDGCIEYSNKESIRQFINKSFSHWENNKDFTINTDFNVSRFSRKNLTEKLALILNQLTTK